MLQGTSSNAGKSILQRLWHLPARRLQRRAVQGCEHVPEWRHGQWRRNGPRPDRAGAGRPRRPGRPHEPHSSPHSDTGSQVVILGQPLGHMTSSNISREKRELWEDRHRLRQPRGRMRHRRSRRRGQPRRDQPQGARCRQHAHGRLRAGIGVARRETSTGAGSTPPSSEHGCPSPTPNAGCSPAISSTGSGGRILLSGPRTNTCWLTPEFPLGTIPYIRDLNIPEEDMAGFHGDTPTGGEKRAGTLDIAVVMLRHVSTTPTLRRSPPNPTSACVRCAVRRNGATLM